MTASEQVRQEQIERHRRGDHEWQPGPYIKVYEKPGDLILVCRCGAMIRRTIPAAASRAADDEPFTMGGINVDRLTAIIESRMSRDLAWLRDDGKTVDRWGPELVAAGLVHLYLTGDTVSGLPPLQAEAEAGSGSLDVLREKAADPRYSDEWIGNAFRAALAVERVLDEEAAR